ncbi:MAG: TrmH family RNA methyltransferase [Candidatus Paceibacterota bacterium]|jgi:tRNA G18 (ribose-2'-O)-methylase SpoU
MNKKIKRERIVILHNIRSTENVGAMFRTSDAGGVNKIYLTGHTPTPLDRFGKKNLRFTKSALGAEEYVKWEQKKSIFSLLKLLKKEGYYIVGVEQARNSKHFKKIKEEQKTAYIMGAEVTGIPKSILNKCDDIAEIPMKGKKESLNVSVALGIILFC